MIKFRILCMLVLISSCGFAQDGVSRWQEDIDIYAQKLASGHIDPFHTITKETFFAEVQRIKQDLPRVGENSTVVELMRLTRKFGDGHTSFPLWGVEHSRFPVELKLLSNELYVVGTSSLYKDILGAKLVSIDGEDAKNVITKLSEVVPFSENSYSISERVASYLPNAAVLNGLGVIKDTTEARFVFHVDDNSQAYTLKSDKGLKLDAKISRFGNKWFSIKEKVDDDFWFGASSDGRTIYVKFRRYPSYPKMERFAQYLLKFINKNASQNLIIDLRDNYGGDFFVGLVLAQQLVLADSINWKTGVYTLIDNVTFSAAMSNAAQFSQILNSKLIGSPTGARPSGYQDMGQFRLPHSNLEVTYSKRIYHFKEDNRDALYPDVRIDPTIDDYLSGYDRQLQWVLNDIEKTK